MEVGWWNNRTEESDTTSVQGTVATGEREGRLEGTDKVDRW